MLPLINNMYMKTQSTKWCTTILAALPIVLISGSAHSAARKAAEVDTHVKMFIAAQTPIDKKMDDDTTKTEKSAASESGALSDKEMRSQVLKSNAIKIRVAANHLIDATVEKGDEKSVHVHLSILDSGASWTFSLGHFVVLKNPDGTYRCLDEFGEKVPLPFEKPEREAFNKGDLLAIKAFDLAAGGKYASAVKELDQAVKLAPSSFRIHNDRGVLLAINKKYPEARKEFTEAIKLNDGASAAFSNRAWVFYQEKNNVEAVADAKRALALNPALDSANLCLVTADDKSAPATVASTEDAAKESSDREAVVADSSGTRDEGTAESTTATATTAGTAAPTASENKDSTAAAAAAAAESDTVRTGQIALKAQAETQISEKDWKAARVTLKKIIIGHPDDADAVIKLAYVADMDGDLDEALARAKQAAVMVPDNAEVHRILGRYMEKNRDPRAAALQYETALDILGKENAKEVMKQSLAIEGALLRTIMEFGDFKKAEALTKTITKRFPNSAQAHYNRGWILAQGPEASYIKSAIAEYDSALKLDSKLVQAHFNLAPLLIKAGDHGRAQSELKTFIEACPEDPDIESAKKLLSDIQSKSN